MKSRAKTAEATRKSIPPKAGKSIPPKAGKSIPPKARKSMPPPPSGKKAAPAAADDGSGKRRMGMRGAAPWAARHAAKHAEEAAARALEPPKPGSARGTLRTPDNADSIKQRISELHNVLVRIRGLRKNLNTEFFRIGNELRHIQEEKLYEAKGFSSFETFAERELDFGKATALKLTRVPEIFLEAAAQKLGAEAVLAAMDTLDEHGSATPQRKVVAAARPNLPVKPLKPPR